MKNKIILSLILIGFLFIGCDPNDPTITDSLNGTKWIHHPNTPSIVPSGSLTGIPVPGYLMLGQDSNTVLSFTNDRIFDGTVLMEGQTFYYKYNNPDIRISIYGHCQCPDFWNITPGQCRCGGGSLRYTGSIEKDTMKLYMVYEQGLEREVWLVRIK